MSYVDLAGGFPVVSQRLLESKVVIESLVAFWREYTTIEETYSKSLRELVNSPAAGFRSNVILQRFANFFNESHFEEGKSVKIGWTQVKEEIEAVANFHSSFSGNLKKEVISKLELYLSDSEPRKKQVVNRGKSALSDIKKVQANLDKEREKYQRLTKEVETLVKLMSETQLSATRNAKVQTQVAGLKKEVEACVTKYKSYFEEHRALHNSYYIKQQPNILQEMQTLEEERIDLVKGTIDQFNDLSSPLLAVLKTGSKKIKTEAANISRELDIQEYVESLSDYAQPPTLPGSEPSDVTPDTPSTKSSTSLTKPIAESPSSAKPNINTPENLDSPFEVKHESFEMSPAKQREDKPVVNGKQAQQEQKHDMQEDRVPLATKQTQLADKQPTKPGLTKQDTKPPKPLPGTASTSDDETPLAETARRRRAHTTPAPEAVTKPPTPPPEEPEPEVVTVQEPHKPKGKTQEAPKEEEKHSVTAEPRANRQVTTTLINKTVRKSVDVSRDLESSISQIEQQVVDSIAKDPPQTQLKERTPSLPETKPLPEETSTSNTPPTLRTTTNRFSTGNFRSSTSISSRIERFSQSSYNSSTTYKREAVPTKAISLNISLFFIPLTTPRIYERFNHPKFPYCTRTSRKKATRAHTA